MALFLAAGAGLFVGGGAGFVAGQRKPKDGKDRSRDPRAPDFAGGYRLRGREEAYYEEEKGPPSGWPSAPVGVRGAPPLRQAQSSRGKVEVCRVLANNNKEVDAILTQLADPRSGTVSVARFRQAIQKMGLYLQDEEMVHLSDSKTTVSLDELQATYKRGSRQYVNKFQVGSSLSKMATFVFIGVPLVCMALACIFGAMLSWLEAWPFKECFFLMLMEMGDLDVDLHTMSDEASIPDSDAGKLFAALVGCVSVAIFGAILAVMGGPLLYPFLHISRLEISEGEPHPFRQACFKLLLLVCVALPTSAVVISLFFGFLLSVAEDWSFRDSFYAVLGEIIDSKIMLTQTESVQPTNDLARLVWAIVGLWSLVTFATVIGVVAGPVVHPILETLRLTPREPDGPRQSSEDVSRDLRPPPTTYPTAGDFSDIFSLDGESLVATRPDQAQLQVSTRPDDVRYA